MNAAVAAIAGAAVLATVVAMPSRSGQIVPDAQYQTFEGSWSAAGQRTTLPTERGTDAAIVQLSGAVAVSPTAGLGRGFRGEVIGFADGQERIVGRWVWTDDRGDRIFGELNGDPIGAGKRLAGVITGGSGRYAGLTGDFELIWQYVVTAEDGAVHGRSVKLTGRYRRGTGQP